MGVLSNNVSINRGGEMKKDTYISRKYYIQGNDFIALEKTQELGDKEGGGEYTIYCGDSHITFWDILDESLVKKLAELLLEASKDNLSDMVI